MVEPNTVLPRPRAPRAGRRGRGGAGRARSTRPSEAAGTRRRCAWPAWKSSPSTGTPTPSPSRGHAWGTGDPLSRVRLRREPRRSRPSRLRSRIHPHGPRRVLAPIGCDRSRIYLPTGCSTGHAHGWHGTSAADLLNEADGERWSGSSPTTATSGGRGGWPREIVRRRARAPFAVSDDLVNAIRATLGPRAGPSEFARLFQAVRIAVNDELAGACARPAGLSRRARGRRVGWRSSPTTRVRIVWSSSPFGSGRAPASVLLITRSAPAADGRSASSSPANRSCHRTRKPRRTRGHGAPSCGSSESSHAA